MTHPSATPDRPAGWYPDPTGAPQLRWWNGVTWTEETQALPPVAVSSAGGPPFAGGLPYAGGSPYAGASPYAAGPPYGVAAQYGSNGYSTAAMIFGGLAVIILPIVFGPVGLILAGVARRRGEPRARQASRVAAIGMCVGILLGLLVVSALR